MKVSQRFLALLLGLVCFGGSLLLPEQVQADDGPALAQKLSPKIGPTGPVIPLVYAAVLTGNVPVYASPWDVMADVPPVRYLAPGYLWVSLSDPRPIVWGNYSWYRINRNEYVSGEYLAVYNPSTFRGMNFLKPPEQPVAWFVYNSQISTSPGLEPLPDAPTFWRYTPAIIYEAMFVEDQKWYRVGLDQWVREQQLGVVFPDTPRPEGVAEGERWVEINLYEQTIAAYEGDKLVYASLMSSGLPQWPTVKGLFRIWTKVKMAKMSGRNGLPDYYFLEDVPWTLYFHGAYALHAAYWHNSFGFQHSHGCVNLAPQDAEWLYHWATPIAGTTNWTKATEDNLGTWVWVH